MPDSPRVDIKTYINDLREMNIDELRRHIEKLRKTETPNSATNTTPSKGGKPNTRRNITERKIRKNKSKKNQIKPNTRKKS